MKILRLGNWEIHIYEDVFTWLPCIVCDFGEIFRFLVDFSWLGLGITVLSRKPENNPHRKGTRVLP